MKNKKYDYIDNIIRSVYSGSKRKSIFNFTFFVTFAGPYLITFIYFVLYLIGADVLKPWVNWLLFISFLPVIFLSLLISQKKELTGAYGETILILIPTFVWLLAGHTESIKWIVTFSFVIVVIGSIGFLIGIFMKKKRNPSNARIKIRQLFIRIGFVAASITSTSIVSVILLNWADGALHLAGTGEDTDYTKNTWVIFIALVTIGVALLLVILGMASHYEGVKIDVGKIKFKNNSSADDFLKKTMQVNLEGKLKRNISRLRNRFKK